WSWLPVASVLPSGLKATQAAMSLWPGRTARVLNVAASQRRTVPSLLPEARTLPSEEWARQVTAFACPSRTRPALGGSAGSLARTSIGNKLTRQAVFIG